MVATYTSTAIAFNIRTRFILLGGRTMVIFTWAFLVHTLGVLRKQECYIDVDVYVLSKTTCSKAHVKV